MNERIRELAEQASEKIRYRIDPNTFKHIDDSNGPHTRFEFNKEKFAELIVRECMDQIHDAAQTRWCTTPTQEQVCRDAISKIQERFGIK